MLSTTINANTLNFDAKKNNSVQLIPGKPNTFIVIHAYCITVNLNTPAVVSKGGIDQVNLSYYSNDGSKDIIITSIPLQIAGKSIIISTDYKYQKYFFSDTNETPIGKPLVIKGIDGTKISNITGKMQIKIDYSYLPFEE